MLNEILEFEQYTKKIDCGRLKSSHPLKFPGLKRAMEIVARDFYHSTDFGEEADTMLKVALTRRALRVWLGADETRSGIPAVDKKLAFLKAHSYTAVRDSIKEKKQREAFDKKLAKLRDKGFDKPDLSFASSSTYKPYADPNRITYENVIACAITDGALKRRYLVCRKEPFDNVPLGNNQNGKTKDAVLKGMAAFLLNQTPRQSTSFVVIDYVERWMTATKFMEKGRGCDGLFENVSTSGFYTKLKPCAALMECDFKLLDEADEEAVKQCFADPSLYVFSDNGYRHDAAKSLTEGKRYPKLT